MDLPDPARTSPIQTLTGLQKTVAIAYPLGDVLMLALLARLLAPGTGRARCVQLLTVGAVACLLSDTAFGAMQLHGTFRNGTIVDLGWALFYTAWGAAALHPSMTRLTDPVPRQQVEVSPVRLAAADAGLADRPHRAAHRRARRRGLERSG